jgi:putative endonuclease
VIKEFADEETRIHCVCNNPDSTMIFTMEELLPKAFGPDNLLKKKIDQEWFVYILKCADGSHYSGITNDINKRIAKHNTGKGAKYTRGRGPVALYKSFGPYSKSDALKLEHKIKKLSKKEKLQFND